MKTTVLFTITCFTAGIITGWYSADSRVKHPQHVKPEYYVELKPNGSAVIEDTHGCTYLSPDIDGISLVILKENL